MPATPKRGRGRPSKGPEKEIRLPQEYWDWMKTPEARAHGLSYSDIIRAALDRLRQEP